ncbi:class I SAM-dependent methyltransferase [Streptomyces pseudovenezuelae]|uniref:class I SAM-dependent methyltransferase n=1 Tax=Streptomyces pseudovenezuelae TaxID=67350 RepID=UPI002E81606A|nr:class I SAM-dependent methyltransferase [Streptomyces pseudovenezuelae]WUA93901.1 class I SAM-dependent methyltransferase [Streptomyces pseudovenezuelae]
MTASSAHTPPDLWERYGACRADADAASGVHGAFHWDWYERCGPGSELLGALDGRTVVELGAGAGRQAAHLAVTRAVAEVTALDSSPSMHRRGHKAYGAIPRLRIVRADATAYLRKHPNTFDVAYSVFGAVDFSDPCRLLPAIATSLRAAGTLVFSTLGRYRNGQEPESEVRAARLPTTLADGTPATMERWVLSLQVWERLLARAGLEVVGVQTVHDAGGDHHPPMVTRIVRAVRPPGR